ncbi:sigma factor regulatory protein [Bordetella pertussis]|uniref:Sigma factor regulatory protein n=5 Tax=Bordetella pertussis TaxID=520 RepID=Q7VW37_BORPE|nr:MULTISPECIES: MucB/RseB C-terminal domain-containing protein [Bordetella]ETH37689.1 putative sigma E factor negative regulatory protein ResB [Bordetella pertussis H918]ETH45022.1 putative sigma E factor negative regulatory protein ResB [Bordetella pertussis H939]ETH46877.1 putative sigma E factor negative regulatory protein ResB [Bordetella pertussis H921]ETH72306.1 putative sigma E factor negative regulatory protein ResB [Bordetella pertussis STO1-CHLA-0011]ETH82718.1 putative sigma E fact
MTPLLYMRRPALGRMTWRQRQTAGLAAMAVLMGLMAIYARPVRAAAPAVPEDPVLLLSSIQQAARKQDYAGVFMYQQGESIQSSRLVHVLDGTGERERLEILDGQPREYLRHNEDVQCLIPERKTVLLERRRGDRFPGLLLGDPAGLAENYHIRAESQLHRVADRQCRLITVEPRDALRYGYRLCADVATNLLLKAQTLDAARRVVEQVSFTSIRLGGDVDPAMLTSRWSTRDWRVLEPVMKPVDLAAQGWRITAPKGFSAVLQVARSMGPATVNQLVLSDGLAAISVFIEPYDSRRHAHPPEGLARRGAINIYGTRIADFWLTALGEVPAGTLEQLAETTEYVPVDAAKQQ